APRLSGREIGHAGEMERPLERKDPRGGAGGSFGRAAARPRRDRDDLPADGTQGSRERVEARVQSLDIARRDDGGNQRLTLRRVADSLAAARFFSDRRRDMAPPDGLFDRRAPRRAVGGGRLTQTEEEAGDGDDARGQFVDPQEEVIMLGAGATGQA